MGIRHEDHPNRPTRSRRPDHRRGVPPLRGPRALRPSVITNLEDGIDAIGRCEYCSDTLEMTVAALGGQVWPDPT
jgi:hypothetical protein